MKGSKERKKIGMRKKKKCDFWGKGEKNNFIRSVTLKRKKKSCE